jgi:hypothetical protein
VPLFFSFPGKATLQGSTAAQTDRSHDWRLPPLRKGLKTAEDKGGVQPGSAGDHCHRGQRPARPSLPSEPSTLATTNPPSLGPGLPGQHPNALPTQRNTLTAELTGPTAHSTSHASQPTPPASHKQLQGTAQGTPALSAPTLVPWLRRPEVRHRQGALQAGASAGCRPAEGRSAMRRHSSRARTAQAGCPASRANQGSSPCPGAWSPARKVPPQTLRSALPRGALGVIFRKLTDGPRAGPSRSSASFSRVWPCLGVAGSRGKRGPSPQEGRSPQARQPAGRRGPAAASVLF